MFMSAPGSSRPCWAIEVEGGMRPAQKLAPDLLIGRHRLHRRVVLIGADEVGAIGAGGAQHGIEVLEDALRLLLALGQAGVRRRSASTSGAMPLLKSCAISAGGEHPAAGLHALREFDLARAELDGQQRLRVLVSHSVHPACWPRQLRIAGGPRGRCSRSGTSACKRMRGPAVSTGASHDATAIPSTAFGLSALGALLACMTRRAGAAGELSEPADHHRRAVPAGGLTDVPARLAAAMLQEKLGQGVVIENKTGGSGVVGAAYAARATPDGYTLFANSLADTQNLHYLPVNYNPVDDFAQIGWIVDGPPLVLIINAKPAVQDARRIARRRQGQSEQVQLRHVRAGLVAGLTLAQLNKAAQAQISGGALSRLGRCGAAAAGGAIQGAFTFYSQAKPLVDDGKVRAVAVAAPKRLDGLAGRADLHRAGLQDRPARLRRACRAGQDAEADRRTSSASISTRWCRATGSRSGWRRSAWRRRRPPRTRRRSSTGSCATRSRGRAKSPSCRDRSSQRRRSDGVGNAGST